MATVRHLGLFPRCATKASVLDEGMWLSSIYATASYWRVKKWRLSYDITWRFIRPLDSPPSDTTFSYSNTLEVLAGQWARNTSFLTNEDLLLPPPFGNAYTSEKELLCGENTIQPDPDNADSAIAAHFAFSIQSGLVASGGRTSSTTMTMEYDLELLQYREQDERPYRMPLRFFYTASVGSGGIFSSQATSSRDTQSDALTVKLLDEEFKCDIYTQFVDGAFTKTFVTDMAVTLEATEYWPYDPEDGLGPIYDSATGAQLRPFPQ